MSCFVIGCHRKGEFLIAPHLRLAIQNKTAMLRLTVFLCVAVMTSQ